MAANTSRQQRYQASLRNQHNPYELQSLPSSAVVSPPVCPFGELYENPFSSSADRNDSLHDIPLGHSEPKHPKVATLRATRDMIKARRAAGPYPPTPSSPTTGFVDVELQQSNNKKVPGRRHGWKRWSILLGLVLLVVMFLLALAIGIMTHEGLLYPYVEDGECRVFGGLLAAMWRCEGMEGMG